MVQEPPRALGENARHKTVRFSHDHSGAWMAAVKDTGVDTDIRFARLDVGQGSEPRWYLLPHANFDGVGAFAHLLRHHGHPDLKVLPQHHGGVRPSLLNLLRAGACCLALPTGRCDSAIAIARVSAPQSGSMAWHVFDSDQTRELTTRAKREGVSVNSFLLFALGRAFQPISQPPDGSARWMIPLNMRGLVRGPRDTANHVSYLRISVSHQDSPQSIQGRIRSQMERNEHWWRWYCYRYGSRLGRSVMRLFVRADFKWGKPLFGCFSNLGDWGLSGPFSWVFCPPVARTMPVGAGCVTYGGRMGLALQIHSSYEDAGAVAESTLRDWVFHSGA